MNIFKKENVYWTISLMSNVEIYLGHISSLTYIDGSRAVDRISPNFIV